MEITLSGHKETAGKQQLWLHVRNAFVTPDLTFVITTIYFAL
jgi:hypothetical protein